MDIRFVRGRNQRVWLWTIALVAACTFALVATLIFGDAQGKGTLGVGAAAGFGNDRAPVLPVVIEPFQQVKDLKDRELGRLLRLTGTAESGVRRNAVYVRAVDGRRVLVRFEPAPPPAALRSFYPGAGVNLDGYLLKVSRAEFDVWMDTLGVVVPRPAPGVKFGDLPDSNFIRVDSLFVKDYYISVRPEGIHRGAAAPPPVVAAPPAAAQPAPAEKRDTAPRIPPEPATVAPPPPATPADTVRP